MKKPMYEVLGTITLPVYKCPDGVLPPSINISDIDTVEMMGVYVESRNDLMPMVILPDNVKEVKHENYTTHVSDNDFFLEHIDGGCAETCESIKSELENTVSRLLEKASVEELISLRVAKLI